MVNKEMCPWPPLLRSQQEERLLSILDLRMHNALPMQPWQKRFRPRELPYYVFDFLLWRCNDLFKVYVILLRRKVYGCGSSCWRFLYIFYSSRTVRRSGPWTSSVTLPSELSWFASPETPKRGNHFQFAMSGLWKHPISKTVGLSGFSTCEVIGRPLRLDAIFNLSPRPSLVHENRIIISATCEG